ncbi:TetR/AcrR family transcriptional regulator, partial [Kribbia dieselivorans]|uniref:TetR/AcrR family transcriptional regulator n=1 Tax=Kribbia dieselivorans TaxID=331526 RepID=UPI000837E0EB
MSVDNVAIKSGLALIRGKNVRGLRTRGQLLDAALAQFSEHGFAATRVADIAGRAGVSTGNFYRHFTSKGEIFLETLEGPFEALRESSRRVAGGDTLDHQGLFAAHRAFLATYTEHRGLFRAVFEAAASREDASVTQAWLRTRRLFIDRTTHWLRSLHARGLAGEGDWPAIAEVLCSAADQTAHVNVGLPDTEPTAEELDRIAAALAHVWLAAIPTPAPLHPRAHPRANPHV